MSVTDKDAANCAWSDFRKDYGVSANEYIRTTEHRAFHAGWEAARADVLVIPRTDLPEVAQARDGTHRIGTEWFSVDESATAWTLARQYLAIAEYLDAHPPIDQAQVNTLATLLRDTGARPSGADAIPIARRLIATGRVTVTDPA